MKGSYRAWDRLGLTRKIGGMLKSAPKGANGAYTWSSPYQLAIQLPARYPKAFAETGFPIGGAGCDSSTSWTSDLASSLIRKVDARELPGVEYSYLSNDQLESIIFTHPDPDTDAIENSATRRSYPLSLFRLEGRA